MNTKYELSRLEGIISKDISTFIKMNCTLDQVLFADFKEAIKDETERIKNNLTKAIFIFRKRRAIKQYIRFHQREIIRLSGYLLNYVPPKRIHTTSKSLDNALLCQQLYWSLEELLRFVEKHFTEYFDQDAWIPEGYRRIVIDEIQKNIRPLQTGLLQLGVRNELVGWALYPLKEFVENPSTEITYRKLIYVKELEKELYQLIDTTGELTADPSLSVQWLLFYLNFNPLKYFNYCTNRINLFVNETENLSERIERLSLVQKLVNQYQARQGIGYDLKLKSLKEQLVDWLSQEITFLEKKQKNILAEVATDNAMEPGFKLKVDMSVPQLSYLLRVFVETHIIKNENIAFLLRFLTKIFQTKRTDDVSYDSAHNKYYNAETSTKGAVKKLLLRMVAYIDRDSN